MSAEAPRATASFLANLRGAPRRIAETCFRSGRPRSDRTRSTFVFCNVFLERALRANDGDATLKASEQFGNLRVRLAESPVAAARRRRDELGQRAAPDKKAAPGRKQKKGAPGKARAKPDRELEAAQATLERAIHAAQETIRDCLTEAMDLDGLIAVLEKIEQGAMTCLAVDTPMPSAFCHEILNANPYAFLDDAPLEERRARAVDMRRSLPPELAGDMGALDQSAIDQVIEESWPVVRDAEEFHDALLSLGWVRDLAEVAHHEAHQSVGQRRGGGGGTRRNPAPVVGLRPRRGRSSVGRAADF